MDELEAGDQKRRAGGRRCSALQFVALQRLVFRAFMTELPRLHQTVKGYL